MHFFIIVLIFCFFVFLFSLYFFAHDDLTLFKKDVSMEKLFNIAFITSFVSLFASRLLYVLENPSSRFFNPLVFFLFPYFPGLSLTGAVVGGGIFLFSILKLRKMPTGRIFDFFSLSALASLPLGFVGYFLLSGTNFISAKSIFTLVSYILIFALFALFLLPRLLKGKFKDGSLALLFLFSFSVISLLSKFFNKKFSFGAEEAVIILLMVVSLSILVKRENLILEVVKISKRIKK